eukprot:1018847-Prymnesium_polylepis.1
MPRDLAAPPLVLVHGFFGYGSRRPLFGLAPPYFDLDALRAEWPGEVVAVDIGGNSSNHDRACEVVAQLKGLRTDYGEEHAVCCGHDRFGEDHTGRARLSGRWDASRPVHIVGHSFGGNTAL